MFKLAIKPPQVIRVSSSDRVHIYDEDLHDTRAALADMCEALESVGAKFVVEGFGVGWTVDAQTDLAVILEQVPTILKAMRQRLSCEVHFYEQGIQRLISISNDLDPVKIHCTSPKSSDCPPSAPVSSGATRGA